MATTMIKRTTETASQNCSLCFYVTCPLLPQGSWIPNAQHINFGHSHPPRKINPKMPIRDPQNEFFGVPWISLLLGSTRLIINFSTANPGFSEFSGISLERAVGILESRSQAKVKLISLSLEGRKIEKMS